MLYRKGFILDPSSYLPAISQCRLAEFETGKDQSGQNDQHNKKNMNFKDTSFGASVSNS